MVGVGAQACVAATVKLVVRELRTSESSAVIIFTAVRLRHRQLHHLMPTLSVMLLDVCSAVLLQMRNFTDGALASLICHLSLYQSTSARKVPEICASSQLVKLVRTSIHDVIADQAKAMVCGD